MMTVDEAVPECVVRIAVYLAIGHPRRCWSWASRGPRGGPVGIGAGAERHCARGETATDGGMLVIGESGAIIVQEEHVTSCIELNPLALCLRSRNYPKTTLAGKWLKNSMKTACYV